MRIFDSPPFTSILLVLQAHARRRSFFSGVLALTSTLFFSPALLAAKPEVNNIYLDELVAKARALHLAETPQWQRLLHYQTSLWGRLRSEADDPAFFTAANGKYDAQAELEATLAQFFSEEFWGEKKEPAQCAFIARYEWLNSQLQFDTKKLSPQACPEFDTWYAGINPGSLALIFPSAYINNPSSMFGHTLLRVDAAGQNRDTRLLSYAVNYGAEAGADNGMAFAVKGIFGGYYGSMGIGPYYKKVKEYTDFESRDIWEYELAFTGPEIRRLMAHVWELRGIHFEYYFFDENCSYLMLTLLDVARPSLELSQQLRGWVIPSDTLRIVAAHPTLIKKTVFRPAAGSKLAYLANALSSAAQEDALALANNEIQVDDFLTANSSQYSAQDKADIILLAHDYVRYEFLAKRRDKTAASPLSRKLLRARSTITSAQAPKPVPMPRISPEQGHKTGMVQTGVGVENNESFLQLRFRPAYHDLLDNDDGYVPGAQIDFLNIAFRYYADRKKSRLNELTLIDIISLSPRNRFFHPVAWRVRASWQRRIFPDAQLANKLVFRADGGGGIAIRPSKNILGFALLNSGIDINSQFKDHYTAGIGAETGIIVQATPRWKWKLLARHMNFLTGNTHSYNTFSIAQRFSISPRHALSLQWTQQRAFGHRLENLSLSWRWYL